MRRLYVIVPGADLTARLVQELLSRGLPEQGIRLFARRPVALTDLQVPVMRLRVGRDLLLGRTLAGAAIGLTASVLIVAVAGAQTESPLMLAMAILAGAAVGAATATSGGFPAELRPMQNELARNDVVMLIDVPDEGLGELEDALKSGHPELRIEGTDPAGTPPFP